ncbi:MAG TPA: methylated-DNA--[protein]-cysteine S-methyltransferase [Candidatus Sulfomarinibacteraceae bacterium]|nr:methylated-DNA--[protein]-cysteine S-methyltransferase [Candidatus Sulfomarinibacteraceae bacterium]
MTTRASSPRVQRSVERRARPAVAPGVEPGVEPRGAPGVDPALEAGLARLAVKAPASLAAATLVAVGLADRYAELPSPIGSIVVAWNGRGISWVDRADDLADFERRFAQRVGRPLAAADAVPADLVRAVTARLAGNRRVRVPLDLRGRTEFEVAVWMKALEIPRGEVRPYGWIAAEIGRPRAVRAVGTALAHNPVPLVVPCHRVVRSDGSIGQYSLGGPAAKRAVLAAEGLDPDELEAGARSGLRYLGSDSTHVVCLPSCHNARRITPRHRVPFRSLADAAAAGYRACRECRPASGATLAA